MSGLEYLNKVLVKYTSKCSIISRFAIHTQLKKLLTSWAQPYDINIIISGSTTKETAISLSSDLDYFIELPYSCNFTYKNMYNDLHKKLSSEYYSVRKQNVSIGIETDNLKIDITPGIKQSGNTNYYSIYKSKSNSWTQTNIRLHNQQISNSGRTSEIKLLKIWRELNRLEFPSIYLEYLLKDRILLGRSKSPDELVDNFYYTLEQLAREDSNPLYSRMVDPSNSSNIFSELINLNEKQEIIQQAKRSLNEAYWSRIVY